MAGVRLHHETAKNARFTVVENDRPYPTPYECPPPEFGGCGITHMFKTHHLNLDDTGSVIISTPLYEKLKGLLGLNGFTMANEVKSPPPMGVALGERRNGFGSWGNIPIIKGEEQHG